MKKERLEVVVKSISMNTIAYQSFREFMIQKPHKCSLEELLQSESIKKYINPFKIKKMSIATVLGIVTVKEMLENVGIEFEMMQDSGIVVGTNYACFDKFLEFYTSACSENGVIRSNVFSNSANSALSGEIAAEIGMKAASFTISAGKLSAFEALYAGYQIVACGMAERQIVAEIDAYEKSDAKGHTGSEGAVALLLQKKEENNEENYGFLSFVSEEEADSILYGEQYRDTVTISSIREQADIFLNKDSKMLGLLYGCAILKEADFVNKICKKKESEKWSMVNKVLVEVGDENKRIIALIKRQPDKEA